MEKEKNITIMGSSSCLSEGRTINDNNIINNQVLEEAKEIKNDKGIIIKAKKTNEFEKLISEKNIEKSIESLYILKDI